MIKRCFRLKFEINVEKKHLIYFGLFLVVLFGGIFVVAEYVAPSDNPWNPGHSASDIGSGVVDGDFHVNGEFAVVSDDHQSIDGDGDDFYLGDTVAVVLDPTVPGYLRIETTPGDDCDDGDPLVNPNGTWTTEPHLHNNGDTDCSGRADLRWTEAYTACGNFDDSERCLGTHVGWEDESIPSCGVEDTWWAVICVWNVRCSGAGSTQVQKVQQCR